jgi:hypothetical protein
MKFYTVRSLGNKATREFQALEEARVWIADCLDRRAMARKSGNPYRIRECEGADPVTPGIMRDFPGKDVTLEVGDEMTATKTHEYEIWEDSGAEETIEAESMEDALEQAEKWASEGEVDTSEGTVYGTVYVRDTLTDEQEDATVTFEPAEPECTHDEGHDWQTPHEILGGIEENPGCWGHGGGVKYTEVCMRCGCGKHVDTWAQNSSTGEQGLTSTSYTEGEYADAAEKITEA